ncbi:nucleotide exchange factor GrpE [Candidatus Falkowbacteria bacterium RIFOXYB2_FULL_34_18]|uniref:Protein GrpE n=1 Tax=Candidatus Falkowbacteria bacterium RIFOXYD2_FULL_34_120 TaxID=1798007 RepID=A0A1F5TMN0_9BACT|nr:MAG: nucleotide exchange factor GrpE [Candidatus Falkowbacteria bacterium RIFOXYB2_FULL_34_18]OGF28354.1 MAG: nucleotide exchange factor GrpE [Candidatus Falkowbacteria bacterium RIFOXYC12_FULL_34_55]OGF37927.1 MAG: nucleotide exchange factor GrpE [Candidatus Falkowbacteria bacterium RIFOXYC2_FULL_34_220]OGF39645.1 MAG: nucleotide exchange factor GrpE [Candidatus Falkowbacteria bacterium RIFOXYD12_FULL_34_57]OGF40084.1 MAG: nucleotide exchange factor GrpE [Candidatus Falkowbacteria bacterium
MSEKKYPRVVVGVFIFNDKDELFLMKAPCWENKYTVPGGKIEYGEKIKDAVEREIREETNMKIENIEFMGVSEGLKLGEKYKKDQKHLIFLNYKARARKTDKIKLSDEGVKYRWLKPEEWLQKDLGEFTREIIEKYLLDNESFEHRYKRALADYQNLVKRSTEERMEFIKYSNEQILLEILPVYENLKISVEHNNNNITDPWFEGVKYVLKQFKDILEKEGVEEIKTMGEKFDIHTMEAVEDNNRKEENHDKKIEEKEEKKEVVIKEVKPGYKLRGKVIIPARVVVG